MSKSSNIVILPSAEQGWDIWEPSSSGMILSKSIIDEKMPKLGNSNRVYLPIANFLSRVEEVYKADSETEISTVKMALEVEMNAVSQDVISTYTIQSGEQKNHYMGVYLSKDNLKKEWKEAEFDISARAYRGGDDLLIWREQGRWVFALYRGNIPIWFDVLGMGELSGQLQSVMTMLALRLQMLGVSHFPTRARVEGEVDLVECSHNLGIEVSTFTRSELLKPQEQALELVPFSVKKWKKQERNNRLKLAGLGLVCLFAILAAGYLFYERQKLVDEIEEYQTVIEKFEPVVSKNTMHLQKWGELERVIAKDWPLEVYKRCVLSIPGSKQIIFSQFEVDPNFVMVRGKATKFDPANMLKANLQKDKMLKKFKWKNAAPIKVKGIYNFTYEGTLRKEGE